jgi:hypothetical protein
VTELARGEAPPSSDRGRLDSQLLTGC